MGPLLPLGAPGAVVGGRIQLPHDWRKQLDILIEGLLPTLTPLQPASVVLDHQGRTGRGRGARSGKRPTTGFDMPRGATQPG